MGEPRHPRAETREDTGRGAADRGVDVDVASVPPWSLGLRLCGQGSPKSHFGVPFGTPLQVLVDEQGPKQGQNDTGEESKAAAGPPRFRYGVPCEQIQRIHWGNFLQNCGDLVPSKPRSHASALGMTFRSGSQAGSLISAQTHLPGPGVSRSTHISFESIRIRHRPLPVSRDRPSSVNIPMRSSFEGSRGTSGM